MNKFDRSSRKRDDHVLYKALLVQHGVKVISITEQTEVAPPQDMLLEGMLEVISEFFNVNLATEVRKGMTQKAKQGYNNGERRLMDIVQSILHSVIKKQKPSGCRERAKK